MHLIYFVFMVGTFVSFIRCLTPKTADDSQSKGHQSDNKLEANIKSEKYFPSDVALAELLSESKFIVERNYETPPLTSDSKPPFYPDKVSEGSKSEHTFTKNNFQVDKKATELPNKTTPKYYYNNFTISLQNLQSTVLNYDVTVRTSTSESISELRPALMTTLTPFDVDVKGNGRLSDGKQSELQEMLPIVSSWEQKNPDNERAATADEKVAMLRFPVTPKGERYHIHDFRLSEGIFLFTYVGQLLTLMHPFDFPVEVLRDAFWNQLSIVKLFTQSLKVEVGFLICLSVGVLLSVTTPGLVLVHACCHLLGRSNSASTTSIPPPPPPLPPSNSDPENNVANGDEKQRKCCRSGVIVFFMHTIHVFLVVGIMAMFVTNEQMSTAVQQTPKIFHAALTDATTFLRNSHLQLNFIMTQSFDQAFEASSADLDNVDNLLGRPIQREMATETGVDVALDALVDVSKAARELSERVEALHGYTEGTQDLTAQTRERLADLRQQVDVFRRQCPRKDRPLCETVEASGLDVSLRLESILNDENLGQIRNLGGDNLTTVTSQARGDFLFIPMHVEKETRNVRNAIRRQLIRQRAVLDDSIWSLDVITRDLSAKVEDARDVSLKLVRGISDMEQWRWLIAMASGVSVLLIWTLLVLGVCCGCFGSTRRATGVLVASLVLICLFTTILWLIALSALLIGGHGEVFVCRPLYDEPEFDALTRLVDNPGVIFKRGGFFSNLLYNNDTLDVSVREVLQKCRQDTASYSTFHLSRVFDVETSVDHRKWGTLHEDLDTLNVNLTGLQMLKPELQKQLQQLLQASSVNLTHFRTQVSGQVTGKDLSSFANQLESVANQITDLATASRIETLASKTRRLLESNVKILEQRKDNLVYQLAAIEIQLLPLQRQVNQSLSHFKTIQYYINNQGEKIAKRKTRDYVRRLIGYLDQYRSHVTQEMLHTAASCRPVWDIYNAMRLLFCRHLIDPLNGFWFTTIWCLLLLLLATPLTLKLMDHYRSNKLGGRLQNSDSADSQTETLMISEQGGTWLTPGTQERDGW